MKFVELKSSLENEVSPVYVILGDDRFVCLNALSIFEKKFASNYPSMNRAVFGEDSSINSIIESALVFPMGDDYRLVEIRDFKPQNEKEDLKVIENYIQNPNESSVVVFFASEPTTFYTNIAKKAILVDCNKLEDKWLAAWIKQNAKKENVSITDDAIMKLIFLTASDLTKISTELSKLASFVGNGGTINEDIVDQFVEKTKEYKVFELTEAAGKRDRKRVFEIMNTMLETNDNPMGIITIISKHFTRLFSIAVSNKTDTEFSDAFKIKPYAVSMLRRQVSNFSPKNLKKIVSLLGELDYKIKSGKMNVDNALVYAVCNILMVE